MGLSEGKDENTVHFLAGCLLSNPEAYGRSCAGLRKFLVSGLQMLGTGLKVTKSLSSRISCISSENFLVSSGNTNRAAREATKIATNSIFTETRKQKQIHWPFPKVAEPRDWQGWPRTPDRVLRGAGMLGARGAGSEVPRRRTRIKYFKNNSFLSRSH